MIFSDSWWYLLMKVDDICWYFSYDATNLEMFDRLVPVWPHFISTETAPALCPRCSSKPWQGTGSLSGVLSSQHFGLWTSLCKRAHTHTHTLPCCVKEMKHCIFTCVSPSTTLVKFSRTKKNTVRKMCLNCGWVETLNFKFKLLVSSHIKCWHFFGDIVDAY